MGKKDRVVGDLIISKDIRVEGECPGYELGSNNMPQARKLKPGEKPSPYTVDVKVSGSDTIACEAIRPGGRCGRNTQLGKHARCQQKPH